MSLRIRCGSGLGDSLYLQAVARHICYEKELEVCTDYPDIFKNLPVKISPFSRENIDIHAVYTTRKSQPTTQFEDCCISAGIDTAKLTIDWETREVIDTKKPIVLVQLPRMPMNREDGFGYELLPDCSKINKLIEMIDAYFVLVGHGFPIYNYEGIDLDLTDKTTIPELLDLASCASGFLGYPSFFVPLAESFNKPALFVWSRRGLRAKEKFVRQVTPKKLLHKPNQFIIDDCKQEELKIAASEFYKKITA